MKALPQLSANEFFAEGQRVGTLKGHHEVEQLLASARNDVLTIEPQSGHIESARWQATENYRWQALALAMAVSMW